jgi:hypothetical protein
LPEASWARIDRLHPAITLFQWTMDAGDPMSVAGDVDLPVTMIIGPGDLQVPDFTSDALLQALHTRLPWAEPLDSRGGLQMAAGVQAALVGIVGQEKLDQMTQDGLYRRGIY